MISLLGRKYIKNNPINLPSLVLLLVLFVYDVFEECEKGFLTTFVPGLHKASVALASRRAAPAEMGHFVGVILLLLVYSALLLRIVNLADRQITPHLGWEILGGFLFHAVCVHLDRPAFATHWLSPAEMLHGVGALVLVPRTGLGVHLLSRSEGSWGEGCKDLGLLQLRGRPQMAFSRVNGGFICQIRPA